MSSDRRYLPRIRLASVLALFLVMTAPAQADDTWHNIYHSLKRFFTGKPSPTPVVHHRVRRSEGRDKANPSPDPTPPLAENSSSPGASATPRVVILPAMSPAPEATPGAENPPARTPESSAKPQPSPELGPVLRSLSGPTPVPSPGVLPSPAPGAGNTTTD